MAITKKDIPCGWSTACKRSFEKLNRTFTSVPILGHLNQERKILVETDAFNLVIARVHVQYDDKNILHLVVYFSKKHFPADFHHEIYQKEPFTMV
jgi:hypothetical protein